jgi:hypothetical protein
MDRIREPVRALMALRHIAVPRIGPAIRAAAAVLCFAVQPAHLAGDTSYSSLATLLQSSADTTWNDARALALMEFARERRRLPLADTALDNYEGRAEGLVYFYLDRRDIDDRVLIRTDQVALEVYWAQPDLTKQRIIGLRDESSLPNRMYYHLDHLTVVQNGFGDAMRMGDGDEVRDVPHPAAPGSGSIYDFRLADSLTLRLPGAPEPIKAYRIEVRPKDTDRPAFVGAVYVDHAGGDIVRMSFTFTPVSYVDPRLDYINVSLDNSLWRGRYWLPYEQSIEIRRQVPQLDFIVSSVIQARFRVSTYEFNLDLPESLFWGYRVVTVPRDEREAYEFDRGIYQDLLDAGLAPPAELQDIRAQAARLIRDQTLSGLPRLRLSLPNASSAFRFNRAEGLYLGWGSSFRASDVMRIEVVGGYAFGARHAPLGIGIARAVGPRSRLRLDAYHERVRDIGVTPGASGAFNTLASLWGDDYLDPFHATGATLSFERAVGARARIGFDVSVEEQRSASLEEMTAPFGGDVFRPVRAITGGNALYARIAFDRPAIESTTASYGLNASVEAGVLESEFFATPTVSFEALRGSADRRSTIGFSLSTGAVLGTPAPQHLFLAGGRHTIPGYAYRSFAGEAFAIGRVEATRDILFPFLRGRVSATAGWLDNFHEDAVAIADDAGNVRAGVPASWGVRPTESIRTSIGAGIGLGWDLLRLDLVRGLNSGGEWQFLVSVDPRFWPIL